MRLRQSAALGVLPLLAGLLAACAARRPAADEPCAGQALQEPEAAICGRDASIETLRARFRADVEAGGTTRSAEGVLAWRAPGALRVKLFTMAGLTVYDALLVGDGERVRGAVRRPLSGHDETFDLGPGEPLATPEADLSLVLWSLWRPRCTQPPARSDGGMARYALDPAPARALTRDVVLAGGTVREEVLTRTHGGHANGERIIARYADYDCAQQASLPRRIEVEAPASGWRAHVRIIEQSRNVTLDDALFVVPAAASDAGS